jgi:hypothetical protein
VCPGKNDTQLPRSGTTCAGILKGRLFRQLYSRVLSSIVPVLSTSHILLSIPSALPNATVVKSTLKETNRTRLSSFGHGKLRMSHEKK